MTFALTFTVGFVTGHCCHKQRQLAKTSESAEKKSSPLYDTVVPEHLESKQGVAMNENIAYSIMQPIGNRF